MKGYSKKQVDFVFQQNPELGKIGTKEDYLEYLKTIFPESKVREIVYHGSKKNKLDNFDTISNWTPRGNLKFRIKQEISKGLFTTKNINFLNVFKRYNTMNKIYPLVLDIRSPSYIEDIVNSNDVEIDKVLAMQEKHDSIISDEGGYQNTIIPFESSQIHILGSKIDIKNFGGYIKNRNRGIPKKKSLEEKVVLGVFISLFIFSLFLLSPNLTGNIIGNLDKSGSNFLGIILFFLGIFGFFISKRLIS
jgi:hypothetical protein